MEEKVKKQLEFLIADFHAAKNEIRRRSNLQKVALSMLIAAYAWFIPQMIKEPLHPVYLIFVWLIPLLVKNYYKREGIEIGRLGDFVINKRIIATASEILGVSPGKICPTEVPPTKDDLKCKDAQMLRARIDKAEESDKVFLKTLYIYIPVLITLYNVCAYLIKMNFLF